MVTEELEWMTIVPDDGATVIPGAACTGGARKKMLYTMRDIGSFPRSRAVHRFFNLIALSRSFP